MSDLGDLSRDLGEAADRIGPEAKQVVSKGSLNIKNDTQQVWKTLARRPRRKHAKLLWRAVDYDVTSKPGGDIITGEIGPNLDKPQGPLGGIIEDGDGENEPIPALGPAWMKESPRFEDALGDLGKRLLDG